MKYLKGLFLLSALVCLFSCGDDNTAEECVLCTQGNQELEVCVFDENFISVGLPGSSTTSLYENSTVAAEVADLEATGFNCQ